MILRRPDHLDLDEHAQLAALRARSPQLDATADHVAAFAQMMAALNGEQLGEWMGAVEADDLPHLHSFIRGIRRDHATVLNGLSLPYSSGAVEGEICKIKYLKRKMLGRANFDLLRKMALLN
ncbi:transposase [Nonomuraea dietziae]|uniref:transposase n=1 Tax=Nonomuraea dietziae TaxID=65515 RepID=UPI003403BD34